MGISIHHNIRIKITDFQNTLKKTDVNTTFTAVYYKIVIYRNYFTSSKSAS